MTQYYYDFCCRSGGNNLNAGTLTALDTDGEPSTSPLVTYTSGTWVAGTGVFTVASGDPVAAGVAVGHWASVYPDGTTPSTVFVGRISARTTSTITVQIAENYMGTAPTNGTNTRTLRVGGAWAGPSGSSAFPINIFNTHPSSTTFIGRVNFKNDQTYNITATMTATNQSGKQFQGYSSTYGDGGKATIDGGTSGASYELFHAGSGGHLKIQDLIFQNNGATGLKMGVNGNTTGSMAVRCVFRDLRGYGIAYFSGGLVECEAYGCNQVNTTDTIESGAGIGLYRMAAINCISHHNVGGNTAGFMNTHPALNVSPSACVQCISHANGSHGFRNVSTVNCDAYDNGGDGFRWEDRFVAYCENSNAIANTGWGFNFAAGCIGDYAVLRYGAGTMANGSGGINIAATAAVGETEPASAYPANVHPWSDPDNGDFRIVLGAAMGTGRGEFTQEYAGFSDVTTMYPDIGAVWHKTGMRMPKRMEGGF